MARARCLGVNKLWNHGSGRILDCCGPCMLVDTWIAENGTLLPEVEFSGDSCVGAATFAMGGVVVYPNCVNLESVTFIWTSNVVPSYPETRIAIAGETCGGTAAIDIVHRNFLGAVDCEYKLTGCSDVIDAVKLFLAGNDVEIPHFFGPGSDPAILRIP